MIAVFNDGKDKHQSFEAKIDFPQGTSHLMAVVDGGGWIIGYGATEEEALENARTAYHGYVAELQALDLTDVVKSPTHF